jgi:phosphate transport system permease protein
MFGKNAKRVTEKSVRGILAVSATFTSLVVVLIVIFLFREGLGVFSEKPIEKDFILAVNRQNPVKSVEPATVKRIFDGEISSWKQAGGADDSIILFTINDIGQYFSDEEIGENFEFLPKKINELISREKGIIAYLPKKYLTKDFSGHILNFKNISPLSFLSGKEWFPTSEPVSQIGVYPLIMGTLWVCLGAIILAVPLGLAAAIYMSEIANFRVRRFLKPVIELLAGIPSVVYGFFGLIIIVPLVQRIFDLPVGETGLSGSIILAIMVLPTIISISEDALRTCPNSMREASLALGASKWQTIRKVVIPHSLLGITAAIILGIGRAFGETMAVLMVTGNAAVIPDSFLKPVRTITATIAAELGEAPQGGLHYKALFALGCILFLITMIINLIVEWVARKKTIS